MVKAPSICPVCKGELVVKKLACKSCHTTVENSFAFNIFEKLSEDQVDFVLEFIRSDGSIKDMEKALGISYPTVKNRLAEVKRALGLSGAPAPKNAEILDMLKSGEISVDEAARMIRQKKDI